MTADRLPVPVRIGPPPPGWTGGGAVPPQPGLRPRGRARRTARTDRPTAAMVFGILSLVANVLLLPSLIGILYGARSLRAGTAQRGQAITGIVCGSIGAVVLLVQLALVLTAALLPPAVDGDHVAASITASAARSGSALTGVTCPTARAVRSGSTITCTGQAPGVGPVIIDVAFTGSGGGFSWRVERTV